MNTFGNRSIVCVCGKCRRHCLPPPSKFLDMPSRLMYIRNSLLTWNWELWPKLCTHPWPNPFNAFTLILMLTPVTGNTVGTSWLFLVIKFHCNAFASVLCALILARCWCYKDHLLTYLFTYMLQICTCTISRQEQQWVMLSRNCCARQRRRLTLMAWTPSVLLSETFAWTSRYPRLKKLELVLWLRKVRWQLIGRTNNASVLLRVTRIVIVALFTVGNFSF